MEIHEKLKEELTARLARKKQELEKYKGNDDFYTHQLEGVVWTLEDTLNDITRLELWAKRGYNGT